MYSDRMSKPIRRKIKSVILRPHPIHHSILKDNSENTILEADLDDITNGLEQLHMVIAKKAVTISPLVHETTLGPKVKISNPSDESSRIFKDDSPSEDVKTIPSKYETTKSHPSEPYHETYSFHQKPRRNDKLLFELDQERRRCVYKTINNRINVTIRSYKAAQDLESDNRVATDLRAHLDHKRALKDAEYKVADEMLRKQQETLAQRQRQQYEREKAALLAEKVKQEQEEQRMLNEFLLHEKEFKQIYQSLSESINCCADKQALFASNVSSFSTFKSLSDLMTQLTAQISAGDMSHVALQKVSAITRQCETYSKILQEEIKKVNKNVLEKERLEQKIAHQQKENAAKELKAKEAAAAAVAAAAAAARADAVSQPGGDAVVSAAGSAVVTTVQAGAVPSAVVAAQTDTSTVQRTEGAQQQNTVTPVGMKAPEELRPSPTQPASTQDPKKVHLGYLEGCVDAVSFQTYKKLMSYLAEFQSSFSQLSRDPQYKDFTFNCKKAVNIPVNAIGDQSGDHLLDKFHRLSTLLKGGTVQLSNVPFRATGHPQGIDFCMDLLASKLVDQGKTTVSSRAETAFPIAAVIVALWVEIPAFGQVIQAHFFKACPYLVPIFFPQVEGQSDEEYWKSRGYQFENGRPEKEATFVKKMGGIMQLYAAVIVSNVRRQQRAPHPLGVTEGWRWISCWVNIAPQPAISASLLLTFLEVAGHAMNAAYHHQFQKVLHLVCKGYLQKIKETDTPGAGGYVSRLESFLHTMFKTGQIPPPKGALPAHFW